MTEPWQEALTVPCTCEECGKPFPGLRRRVRRGLARFCSRECTGRFHGKLGNRPLLERFWEKVNKTTECWLWLPKPDAKGYGKFSAAPDFVGTTRAHRIAWALAAGSLPLSKRPVCHTCDTPACVRNDDLGTYTVDGVEYERRGHLFLGTPLANARDEKHKGRYPTGDLNGARLHPERLRRGESNGVAKLTTLEVAAIRRLLLLGSSVSALARAYHVERATIRNIRERRTWGHVA